ncbi:MULTISPECIES: SRPBCC domain-containing protein [unclassified Amycolatopsis]|uniref:SRPBCC family protein n=1 Tax=unclassified Amycolatopsis TaxID=2618356 RepID=UPI001FF61269|nr:MULTISPECIES: SRPBCC domain-containing protein [unclassified Amycolatopsis]UOZ06692.1 SRPBCC domain-containing protein [Amycolatopsis sp. WQ 127309]WSJ72993.1 SRPBCC domain-containing protein [Amycolatopsis sp. NBC_01307]WSK83280.1 SRPBCC domain-containing protein [Amycolatopsis sp. NBC_01286]
MADASSATTKEFGFTRIIDAPRERVFEAWTDPDQLAAWWGPTGFSTARSTVSIDARPGGEWAATMKSDGEDGTEVPFHGVYKDLESPSVLSFTLIDDNHVDADNAELIVVAFNDQGEKTEIVFKQIGHLPDEQIEPSRQGWLSFMESLADYLAQA